MSDDTYFRNGQELTYGADGRWWQVTAHNPDGLYGYPLSDLPHHGHRGPNHHHLHHAAHAHAAQARAEAQIHGFRSPGRPLFTDPWGDSQFARELFQGAGAQRFIEANAFVTYATYIATAEYTAAFLAPELLEALGYTTRRVLNRTGAFGPSVNRLFWSGAASGGATAIRYGSQLAGYAGQTLEETPVGRFAVWGQSYLSQSNFTREAWDWLSTGFAEGAEGTVMYFQGAGFYEEESGWKSSGPYYNSALSES